MGQAVSFKLRMGLKHTQVSKLRKALQEARNNKSRKRKKKHFFKDFDEFHNFGLERQSKEEVKYYMLPIPLYNTSICYPHSILALKLYYWTFIIRQKSDS